MKRGIFLSIILGLCLITCIPQVMAQKQSRMEKLLRYLNDNDADKWQKNREKLDDETQTYYSEYSFPMYGTELNSRLSTSWKVRRTRFLSAGQ